jgi:2'-5' RNA ligase
VYIGAVLEDGKHITLSFNGHDETKNDYKRAVQALADAAAVWYTGPIMGSFTELVRFEPAKVWVTLVESERLHQFRNSLLGRLDLRGVHWSNDFGYKPHVTMTKWKEPKSPLTGFVEISHLSVVSNLYGTTEVLI